MSEVRAQAEERSGPGAGADVAEPAPLRLIFDENLSPNVAKALRLVDKDVRYVGRGGVLPKGATDEKIAAQLAAAGDRCMFTKNFDMVMAWADQGGRFIWLDPRYEPTKYDQARLVFTKWTAWERALAGDDVECLKVGMSTIEPLSVADGRARAAARFERQQRKVAQAAARLARARAAPPSDQQTRLDFSDED